MKKILAVSNDRQLLEQIGDHLCTLSFTLETIKVRNDIPQQVTLINPDVLLMDFILGDTNTAAVCHQMTSDPETQNIPVIILSDVPGINKLAAKLGCFAVIKKPAATADIVENLMTALYYNNDQLKYG